MVQALLLGRPRPVLVAPLGAGHGAGGDAPLQDGVATGVDRLRSLRCAVDGGQEGAPLRSREGRRAQAGQVEQGSGDVRGLGQGAGAPPGPPAPREAHGQGGADQALVQHQQLRLLVGLALQAVVAEVVAVVGEVQHRRGVPVAQVVHLLQQAPDPLVHHAHLGRVEGLGVLALGLGHVVRPAVGGVGQHLPPVAGVVPVDVIRRGVPRLVGVEGVQPEEERRPVRRPGRLAVRILSGELRGAPGLVVLLQPGHPAAQGAGGEVVLLALPAGPISEVLPVGGPVAPQLLRGAAGVGVQAGVAAEAVALLAPVPLPAPEAPVEAHRHLVRGVAVVLRDVAGAGQGPGQAGDVRGQGRPAPVGEGEAPGVQVVAVGHRGEGGGVGPLEDRPLGPEAVQVRGAGPGAGGGAELARQARAVAGAAVGPHVVRAQGVRHHHQQVGPGPRPPWPPWAPCPAWPPGARDVPGAPEEWLTPRPP